MVGENMETKIYIYSKDKPMLYITRCQNKVKSEWLTEERHPLIPRMVYPEHITYAGLVEFMETRAVPKYRYNISTVLNNVYHMQKFDIFQMCRLSHGFSHSDDLRLVFEDKPEMSYAEEKALYYDYWSLGIGNQIKYWDRNTLIKVDTDRKESQNEVDAYILGSFLGLDCVPYTQGNVIYFNQQYSCCRSLNFLSEDEIEIPVYCILEQTEGFSKLPDNIKTLDYINFVISSISKFTGILPERVIDWVYDMLVFDYIICNADRHLYNFSVIYNTRSGVYRLAPYFDHGDSFMSLQSPVCYSEFIRLERKYKSKPFSTTPSKNIGNLELVKSSFNRMFSHVNSLDDLRCLNMLCGHLQVVVHRVQSLLSLF